MREQQSSSAEQQRCGAEQQSATTQVPPGPGEALEGAVSAAPGAAPEAYSDTDSTARSAVRSAVGSVASSTVISASNSASNSAPETVPTSGVPTSAEFAANSAAANSAATERGGDSGLGANTSGFSPASVPTVPTCPNLVARGGDSEKTSNSRPLASTVPTVPTSIQYIKREKREIDQGSLGNRPLGGDRWGHPGRAEGGGDTPQTVAKAVPEAAPEAAAEALEEAATQAPSTSDAPTPNASESTPHAAPSLAASTPSPTDLAAQLANAEALRQDALDACESAEDDRDGYRRALANERAEHRETRQQLETALRTERHEHAETRLGLDAAKAHISEARKALNAEPMERLEEAVWRVVNGYSVRGDEIATLRGEVVRLQRALQETERAAAEIRARNCELLRELQAYRPKPPADAYDLNPTAAQLCRLEAKP